jgi:phosphomannomutase
VKNKEVGGMALKFGTSGLRGLVTEMTDCECFLYVKAFLRYLKERAAAKPRAIAIAGDYRPSTPRIAQAVAYSIHSESLQIHDCGLIATPAAAYYGMTQGMASVIITGSHIPSDRNGIKLNMPDRELLKSDEPEIVKRYEALKDEEYRFCQKGESVFAPDGTLKTTPAIERLDVHRLCKQAYLDRYTRFFSPQCLSDKKIVFYQHSSVSREILPQLLEKLGAEVIRVGWSDEFVSIDTEAVECGDRLSSMTLAYSADGLATTDGDGDRPLIVDEKGNIIRGDVLGVLVAEFLKADAVSTPISSNTALEKSAQFLLIERTSIGSPYVIESMNKSLKLGKKRVVGYEANGGFLTASDFENPETGAMLKALPTRDAALPIIAVLALSQKKGCSLSELVAALPPRFTVSGLLRDFPSELGKELVNQFKTRAFTTKAFFPFLGEASSIDFMDGARLTFDSNDIVHLRPSGNAPEFRCYTESNTEEKARDYNKKALDAVERWRSQTRDVK